MCIRDSIYVTLDPPRERTDFVDLEAPRTSYGPRRGRAARWGERKLDQPRVVQKSDQVYSIPRRTRAGFSKPPQPIVALVSKVSSLGEHRVAVAAKPLRAWDVSKRSRAPRNVRRCPGKVHAVTRQCASGGKCGWFGGAGPECRPSRCLLSKYL